MEQGFVIDYGESNARFVQHWSAGAPQKSFWMGTKKPAGPQVPIGVFRCKDCGYLESYARPELGAK